jgi:hypothetical protein
MLRKALGLLTIRICKGVRQRAQEKCDRVHASIFLMFSQGEFSAEKPDIRRADGDFLPKT